MRAAGVDSFAFAVVRWLRVARASRLSFAPIQKFENGALDAFSLPSSSATACWPTSSCLAPLEEVVAVHAWSRFQVICPYFQLVFVPRFLDMC